MNDLGMVGSDGLLVELGIPKYYVFLVSAVLYEKRFMFTVVMAWGFRAFTVMMNCWWNRGSSVVTDWL